MYINSLRLIVNYLKGAPFYWGGLKIPYRDLQTSQYPFLSSIICGILFVFPIYLRNAIIQSRYREYGFVDHIYPIIYSIIYGYLILFIINGLMICMYWLILDGKHEPKYRWVRAHRIFGMSAFYQFILFLVMGILWCWQILIGTGISGYYFSKLLLLLFSCIKISAVFAAIRVELLFGNQLVSLDATDRDILDINKKIPDSNYRYRTILGALFALDVILIWVTI